MASNIGGTATLIGDPPNIIIASKSGLTFNDFLFNLAPIIVVLLGVFVLMCRVMFRSVFVYDAERAAEVMELDEREVISDKRLLIQCGVVLTLVMIGFIGHAIFHLEPSIVALLGAGALVAVSRTEPKEFLEDVELAHARLLHGPVRHGRGPRRGRRHGRHRELAHRLHRRQVPPRGHRR